MARVAALPCAISGVYEVVLHHCRSGSMSEHGFHCGGAQRPSDWLVIPLHPHYHTGAQGIHTLGVETWERTYRSQYELLQALSTILGYDVLELARGNISEN